MRDKKKSGTTIRYWLCQCRSCRSIFNVPQVRNRPLTMEIGRRNARIAASFLVRSNRVHGIPIKNHHPRTGETRLDRKRPVIRNIGGGLFFFPIVKHSAYFSHTIDVHCFFML
jgi:hypothetical protein